MYLNKFCFYQGLQSSGPDENMGTSVDGTSLDVPRMGRSSLLLEIKVKYHIKVIPGPQFSIYITHTQANNIEDLLDHCYTSHQYTSHTHTPLLQRHSQDHTTLIVSLQKTLHCHNNSLASMFLLVVLFTSTFTHIFIALYR